MAASVTFARELGLPFDLLADVDGATARRYVGQDAQGNAVPGVVLVDADGVIRFRQIGEDKADRLGAQRLLDVIDQTFGPVAGAGAAGTSGFASTRRLQLFAQVGGGVVDADGVVATGEAGVGALLPLGRFVVAGPTVHAELRGAVDLAVEARLRVPVLPQVGWLYLGASGGYTVADGRGPSARAGVGLQFAYDPGRALQLELAGVWRAADDHCPSVILSIGVARLLRLHR